MAEIPDFIECGESGSGQIADSDEGVQSRDFDLKAILAAPGLVGYDAAEAFALKKFPLLRRGHRRSNVRVDPIGGGYWVATAHYGNSSLIVRRGGEKVIRFSSWEWETAEKSEKITQAWTDSPDPNAYVRSYKTGDALPPDLKGAIGIDGDSVNGVQKPFSVFNWNETWIYPAEFIDGKRPSRFIKDLDGKRVEVVQNPLINVIEDNCFVTNKKIFRGKPPGCILLTGVRSGRMNLGASSVSVTFSFSYSPLRENFYVGQVKIASKDGWDYMDIYYETEASGNEIVKRAKFVYICQIFKMMDFLDFGLPEDRPRWYLDEGMPGHLIGTPFGE